MSVPVLSNRPGSSAAKTAAIALVILVIVAGAAFAGYTRTVASASDSTLSTVAVARGDVQSSVPADGRVVVREWELGFGATGRVLSVDVSEGESVTAGQVLASLDNSKAAAQVSQAESSLASARARLAGLRGQPIAEEVAAKQAVVDAAISALDRAEEASELLVTQSRESTVSAAELQAKSAAVEAARSQLRIAEANLTAAKVPATASEIDAAEAAVADASAGLLAAENGLEDYLLRAPADGVAVAIELSEGQMLSSGTSQAPAMVIADISEPRIEGELDEVDVTAVRAGMPVDVIVDALGGLSVSGRIERVSEVARVDANELATFAIEVEIDEPVKDLAAGMAVRMQVITDQAASVLTIPTAAVKRSDGNSVVLVVDESGATKSVMVELGKTDGKIVEVVSGLTEGQRVALGSATEADK